MKAAGEIAVEIDIDNLRRKLGELRAKQHRRNKHWLSHNHVMISGKGDRSRTELWKAEHLSTFSQKMSGRCHTEIAQLELECNFSV